MLIWESRRGSWTTEDEARLQAILAGIDSDNDRKPGLSGTLKLATAAAVLLLWLGVLVVMVTRPATDPQLKTTTATQTQDE